jgi:hypothetical protein
MSMIISFPHLFDFALMAKKGARFIGIGVTRRDVQPSRRSRYRRARSAASSPFRWRFRELGYTQNGASGKSIFSGGS